MWSEDHRVAIVFNGEMYNFRAERARLEGQGYRFRSTTDTRSCWRSTWSKGRISCVGCAGCTRLAIFDWRETGRENLPELLLVRDPFGIKPLYLASPLGDQDAVIFASEIRSLLASGLVPRELDTAGLSDYLTYGFVIQPRTMIANVRLLEPGTMERFVPGRQVQRTRFWQMPSSEPRKETLDESAARLRSVLAESISCTRWLMLRSALS